MIQSKNIFLIATDKQSKLYHWIGNDTYKGGLRLRKLSGFCEETSIGIKNQHIYITNDEEIKKGDWCYLNKDGKKYVYKCTEKPQNPKHWGLKIILTRDPKLIADGIQPIPDEFLEWFVKNPSCERVEVKHKDVVQFGNMTMYDHNGDGSHYFCTNCEVETSRSKEELLKFGVEYYKIIIPQEEINVFSENGNQLFFDEEGNLIKEEPKQGTMSEAIKQVINNQLKQETFEEAAKSHAIYELENNYKPTKESFKLACKRSFIQCAKQQEQITDDFTVAFAIFLRQKCLIDDNYLYYFFNGKKYNETELLQHFKINIYGK